MRHIFEVTMVIKKPTEEPHLNRVTFRVYNMTRNEAVDFGTKYAKMLNDELKGPGYDCLYTIAGPRLDD